jgi:release factor glutamine methyltransferase
VTPPPPDPIVARLRAAGCVFAEAEAELLRAAATHAPDLDALVARRAAGEPLEQVLGWAEFAGRRLAVAPGVFVPRRRTELLAFAAAKVLPPGGLALDLCCGVGAVGSVLAEFGAVHAVDIDPAAVACAQGNLPHARVHLGDLYAALPESLRGAFDVIAANAPYVPTAAVALMPSEARDHEARAALDGGADGLDVQRGIIRGASAWLRPAGHLLIETSRAQAPITADLFAAAGFVATVLTDDEVDGTVVRGRISSAPVEKRGGRSYRG